ncbi:MAG: hypothetical protein FD165_2038 [Gammaproteobacteria bacterium]|nr:MAG: hypothetical protein FD165_2038 [Gammaproteobacteria bacterium]TND05030.1 MAG: hypothetical protein FD120_1308 [Gammaproteobacteria bacterium]
MLWLTILLSLAILPAIVSAAIPGPGATGTTATVTTLASAADDAPSAAGQSPLATDFRPASAVLGLTGQQQPDQRDWAGMRKDTAYFAAYQFIVIGVLYVVPESISGWTPQQKENFSIGKWKDHIRHVVWDHDEWYINYILHPYWGAAYYVRAQQRGFGPAGSFWYSAMLSTIYEFGAEAIFERPSIQDMIFTPVGGAFVGDYFMTLRGEIQARTQASGKTSGMDSFLLVATDPLGALNNNVDRLFGKNASVTVLPVFGPTIVPTTTHNPALGDSAQSFSLSAPMLGVKTTIRW